jgi:amphi-Trp domain-containing protein
MKLQRSMTLGEALDEVASVARRLRESETVSVDGHEFKLDDRVTLEIEFEREDGEIELEFEIKWREPRLKRMAKSVYQRLRG